MNEQDPVRRTGLAMIVLSAIPAILAGVGFALGGEGGRITVVSCATWTALFIIVGFFIYRRSLVATYVALVLSAIGFGASVIGLFFTTGRSVVLVLMMGLAARHMWKTSQLLARERA